MQNFLCLSIFYYIIWITNAAISEFTPVGSTSLTLNANDDDSLVLESINGTPDYRINRMKDLFYKPWFDSRDHDHRYIHCVRPAKCERLRNNTCFGSKLPYASTSLALTDSMSQEESQQKLQDYEALRNIPKCWAVIQPFLCAVFAPKCERIKNQDMVYLPSLEMCRITLEPCRMLYNASFFPRFMQCNETFFPTKCSNDVREMKFNAIGQCVPPLVEAESSSTFYKDIDGCGIQCKDPLYTDDEHEYVHFLNGWGIVICIVFNLYAFGTYLIHKKKKHEYPAKNLFYINVCFFINWIGWLIQFYPGNHENIVCRKDGTLRHSEPSAGEANLFCLISFILIYYFLMAAMFWFTWFTYTWYLQTTDRNNIRDYIDKKKSTFHLIAWIFPFVLTITALASSAVDGNSMVGICFVGFRNQIVRIWLVLVPIGCLGLLSVIYFLGGMLRLNQFKKNIYGNSIKLQSIKSNVMFRCVMTILFILAWIIFQIYEFDNSNVWEQSLNEMILCKIRSAYSVSHANCKLESRPSVNILLLRLICIFGISIISSSWYLRKPAFENWTRCIQRLLGRQIDDDQHFTKPTHKVIADAYAKRNESILTVSLDNTHTDPAGVNFNASNLNVNESHEMTSSLRNYIPNLLIRRNAISNKRSDNGKCPTCSSACDSESRSCRSSCESETIHIKTVSYECESRRTSIDSTVSYKRSETEIKLMSTSNTVPKRNRKKRKTMHNYHIPKRRDSNSSGSEIIRLEKSKLKQKSMRHSKTSTTSNVVKNTKMNRRGACTAIDHNAIKQFLMLAANRAIYGLDNDSESLTSDKNAPDGPSNVVAYLDGHQNDNLNSSKSFSEIDGADVPDPIWYRDCRKIENRNMKSSCDVGIQANTLDITSQAIAMNYYGNRINGNRDDSDDDEHVTECQELLMVRQQELSAQIQRHAKELDDDEKLRNLLLPSKETVYV